MPHFSTYDEKATGFYSYSASNYTDAPGNLYSSFYVAAGLVNTASGLLTASRYTADTDIYSLGTLSAGTYTVNASNSNWFYGSGYSNYVSPTVTIYNSIGQVVTGGYFSTATFMVTSNSSYYVEIKGSPYSSSQYEFYYTFTPPTNYSANSGSLAISGNPVVGSVLSLSGQFSDLNGLAIANATNGYSYKWYSSADGVNWLLVGSSSSYTIKATDSGKFINCLIGFIDDAGFSETVSPAATFIAAADATPPSIAITSNRSGLTFGQTATITFALSEVSTNFAVDDVVVSGGALSNFTGSGTSYTATFTPAANSTASGVISVASGSFSDAAGNANADGSDANNRLNLSVNTIVVDSTAPTLQSASPTSGATRVAVDADFVLTFNETVKAGTGSIVVRNGTTTVANINVTDTSQVNFSGSVVTINPINNLEQGVKYSVTVASGVIIDSPGNSWGGTASTAYEFTTLDSTAPTVSTFAPADGATSVAVGANIVLTFSEAIQRGAGKIEIRSGSATGTLVQSFEAATSNLLTYGTDKKLTINPTNDLSANTQYFVTFEAGTVKDLAGNSYAGTTAYDFVTALPTPTAGNDNLTGTTGNDSIDALAGNDTIDGAGGNDTLTGGLGVDTFNITSGTDRVMDLGAGGADVLSVSSGAIANATVASAWTATAATTNSGTANLTSAGFAVNLSAVTSGSTGFAVTNTGKAATFTGSGLADSLTGFTGNDTLIGGGGMDTLTGGAGNDVMTGGAAGDRFVLQGNDTVVDFNSTDSDTVVTTGLAAGTSVTFSTITGTLDLSGSTTTAAFRATAAALGASIVGGSGADRLVGSTGVDSLSGGIGNDTITAGAGADTVTGGRGADSLTGGIGSDTFVFAAGDTGQVTGSDTISDFAKGTVITGDRIDYAADLVIGGSASAATVNEALINQSTGVATFAAKSGATLADALADIATRFTAAGNAAGEFALFRVGGKGNHYLFISDGTAGVGVDDVVVQLVGVTSISGIALDGGNLTITS
jgi:methionine-rich copper-binding protein CopC